MSVNKRAVAASPGKVSEASSSTASDARLKTRPPSLAQPLECRPCPLAGLKVDTVRGWGSIFGRRFEQALYGLI